MSDRTPQDFAIEHGGYLATAAEAVIRAINGEDSARMALDDRDSKRNAAALDRAMDLRGDAIYTLRSCLHGFTTRADLAKRTAAGQAAEIARLSAALAEKTAQLEEERARNAALKPVAWAGLGEDGNVECLGMNQSRRFDTPLAIIPGAKP